MTVSHSRNQVTFIIIVRGSKEICMLAGMTFEQIHNSVYCVHNNNLVIIVLQDENYSGAVGTKYMQECY